MKIIDNKKCILDEARIMAITTFDNILPNKQLYKQMTWDEFIDMQKYDVLKKKAEFPIGNLNRAKAIIKAMDFDLTDCEVHYAKQQSLIITICSEEHTSLHYGRLTILISPKVIEE